MWKAYCDWCYSSNVCLYVCVSVTTVHCVLNSRFRHDFFCIRQPHVSQDRVKIWPTLVCPSSPNFASKCPPPPVESRRHSMAHCGRMVRDSAMVTMESLYETTIALSNDTVADLPSPKMGSQMHPEDQICDACCYLANTIKHINKISFAYNIMGRVMSPFAKPLWPSL